MLRKRANSSEFLVLVCFLALLLLTGFDGIAVAEDDRWYVEREDKSSFLEAESSAGANTDEEGIDVYSLRFHFQRTVSDRIRIFLETDGRAIFVDEAREALIESPDFIAAVSAGVRLQIADELGIPPELVPDRAVQQQLPAALEATAEENIGSEEAVEAGIRRLSAVIEIGERWELVVGKDDAEYNMGKDNSFIFSASSPLVRARAKVNSRLGAWMQVGANRLGAIYSPEGDANAYIANRMARAAASGTSVLSYDLGGGEVGTEYSNDRVGTVIGAVGSRENGSSEYLVLGWNPEIKGLGIKLQGSWEEQDKDHFLGEGTVERLNGTLAHDFGESNTLALQLVYQDSDAAGLSAFNYSALKYERQFRLRMLERHGLSLAAAVQGYTFEFDRGDRNSDVTGYVTLRGRWGEVQNETHQP